MFPLIAAALLLSFAISACGDDPAGAQGPFIPKVGSEFTYNAYARDSLGEKVEGSDEISTAIIAATGAEYAGKNDVVVVIQNMTDTMRLHYESNGDVSIRGDLMGLNSSELPGGIQAPAYDPGWITLPFGSKGSTALPILDSSLAVMGFDININGTGNASYLGSDQITVDGKSFATEKVRIDLLINLSATVAAGTVRVSDTLWFAPELGMLARNGLNTRTNISGLFSTKAESGAHSMLTSYALK